MLLAKQLLVDRRRIREEHARVVSSIHTMETQARTAQLQLSL